VDRTAAGDTRGMHNAVETIRHRGEDVGYRGFVGHIGRHEREPLA
jgi:hypothetical protein